MNPQQSIDAAGKELDKLKANLKKSQLQQVQSREEKQFVKATALSWFNNNRPMVQSVLGNNKLVQIDEQYNELLKYSEKSTSRKKYSPLIKAIKLSLTDLMTKNILDVTNNVISITIDRPPSFEPLVRDADMQRIVARRWEECVKCVTADAPLAATVMMGGLLESLLLARYNQGDKAVIFAATSVPKDKTGKSLDLRDWGLKNYIEVAHELGWISQPEKNVSGVLMDYRNFIHPYKEHSHRIKIETREAKFFWELTKLMASQLLISTEKK